MYIYIYIYTHRYMYIYIYIHNNDNINDNNIVFLYHILHEARAMSDTGFCLNSLVSWNIYIYIYMFTCI